MLLAFIPKENSIEPLPGTTMDLRHTKYALTASSPATPSPAANHLLFFLFFLAANAFKNVVAYTICDGSPTGFFVGLDFVESFLCSLIVFGGLALAGKTFIFLLVYLAQDIFLLVHAGYISLFNAPLHLGSIYRLLWELIPAMEHQSAPLSFQLYFLALIDLPLFLLFIFEYGKIRELIQTRWNKSCVFGAALVLLGALVITTELMVFPKIDYFHPSREGESALIHRYGLVGYSLFDLLVKHDEKSNTILLRYGPETVLTPAITKPSGIVVIQVESLDSGIVDYLWQGCYVTPFLHRLTRESVYFPYLMSYHKAGGTSDCEVAVLNSVEPLDDFPTMKADGYPYPHSMVRRLNRQGFTTQAYHGNNGNFYNRDHFYFSMDFSGFYDQTRMGLISEGWGASDEKVFAFAEKQIRSSRRPFFSYIITMSSHEPFRNVDTYYADDRFVGVNPEMTRSYLKSMAYVDRMLEQFIGNIRKEYPDSYLYIFGDHTPYVLHKGPYQRTSLVMDDRNFEFVPLFILTPDRQVRRETERAVSYLDLAPTILASAGVSGSISTYGENLLSSRLLNRIPLSGEYYDRKFLFESARKIGH
jgi:lipoteichoic acid synthase